MCLKDADQQSGNNFSISGFYKIPENMPFCREQIEILRCLRPKKVSFLSTFLLFIYIVVISLHKKFPPFVSFLAANLQDRSALKSISYYAFANDIPKSERPKPNSAFAGFGLVARFIGRVIASSFSGRWRQSPLFDTNGQIIAKRSPMTKARKSALFDPR